MDLEKQVTEELNRSKIADLRKMLKERKLAVSGKKDELIDRLVPRILAEQRDSFQSSDDGDDNLLDEGEAANTTDLDENVLLGGDELIDDNMNASDEVPDDEGVAQIGQLTIPTCATSVTEQNVASPVQPQPTAESSPPASPTSQDDEHLELEATPVKKLKVDIAVDLTDEEKKKTRVERFGVVLSPTSKEERAKRFGIDPASGAAADMSTSNRPIGILSKEDRAKKFGLPVVGNISNINLGVMSKEDRAKKYGLPNTPSSDASKPDQFGLLSKEERAKRFGNCVSGKQSTFDDDAKSKRAERFASSVSEDTAAPASIKAEILEKRAARFGSSAASNVGVAKWDGDTTYSQLTEAEKRQKRAAKFAS